MKFARRGFLARAAAAVAVAPAMPAIVSQHQGFAAVAGVTGRVGQPTSNNAAQVAGLSDAVWNTFRKRYDEARREAEHSFTFRLDGLEPDLYAMKGPSHQWRVRVQMARDRRRRADLAKLEMKVWPG